MMSSPNTEIAETPSKLVALDTVSDLLDSKFRIPGTETRFGFDFLIGLVPYAGDLLTFGMSGSLVISMVRNGASGMVLAKMLFNIFLDTTVGSVPILGDIFDLKYKSNRRNYFLLKEHYEEGKHTGSIWPIVLLVIFLLIGMFVLLIWIIWKLADFTWGALFG
ncbi:DUF4112 domain-containing protein [Saprospiraceae bacterium]|jgi:hypothetical protein|nr:DUF4112 domain-containing protein [Saprospiraceae bacterium]